MSQKEVARSGLVRAAEKKKITNAEGAEALGLSIRQFRRLRAIYRAEGDVGLVHGNRGQSSPRRAPDTERERVLELMLGKYVGFNDSHLTEKLRTVEQLTVSREWVRRLRVEAKLPSKRQRRAPKHRRRREREAREGALVLIDGSTHDWLEGRGPAFALVGAIDDATGKILTLVVRSHEDLHGYMQMLFGVLEHHGAPLAFYGDRFGALVRNDDHWSVKEQLAGRQDPTHFGRILEELAVAFIAARSPQAKGRIERCWGTLQDRLISEIRLLKLTTAEQVTAYVSQFIELHNARFAMPARESASAWRTAPRHLEQVLTCRYTRTVARDNTTSLKGRWIQLPPRAHGRSWQGCTVDVREGLDGTAFVLHQGREITRQPTPTTPFTLVPREGGNARKRCPQNFVPVPAETPTPKPVLPRDRRGQLTNIRVQIPNHPWRSRCLPQTSTSD